MKKSILVALVAISLQSCLSVQVSKPSTESASSAKQELSQKWLEGKWYPTYFTYETPDGLQTKENYKTPCNDKSYIEFFRKNSSDQFISFYASGANCDQFGSIDGKFYVNESNREIVLMYAGNIKKTYSYQLINDNTLVLSEYRDVNKDGKMEKVMDYYTKK